MPIAIRRLCGHEVTYMLNDDPIEFLRQYPIINVSKRRLESAGDSPSKERVRRIERSKCQPCHGAFVEDQARELAMGPSPAAKESIDPLESARREVRRLVEGGEPFLDAVEFVTDDPTIRLAVFDLVKGWYIQRNVEGLLRPHLDTVRNSFNAEFDQQRRRLVRANGGVDKQNSWG
jgi:hypothetical protein